MNTVNVIIEFKDGTKFTLEVRGHESQEWHRLFEKLGLFLPARSLPTGEKQPGLMRADIKEVTFESTLDSSNWWDGIDLTAPFRKPYNPFDVRF